MGYHYCALCVSGVSVAFACGSFHGAELKSLLKLLTFAACSPFIKQENSYSEILFGFNCLNSRNSQ